MSSCPKRNNVQIFIKWRWEKVKTFAKFLIPVVLAGTLSAANPRAERGNDDVSCPLIEQALKDYQQVRVAPTRREVARYFVPDGGMQFPARTRYAYQKCKYIHVDVEFELLKPGEISSLPDDKVINVSKLYVEYPAKD